MSEILQDSPWQSPQVKTQDNQLFLRLRDLVAYRFFKENLQFPWMNCVRQSGAHSLFVLRGTKTILTRLQPHFFLSKIFPASFSIERIVNGYQSNGKCWLQVLRL